VIEITLVGAAAKVGTQQEGDKVFRILVLRDLQSGIQITVPFEAAAAEQVGRALMGSQVAVAGLALPVGFDPKRGNDGRPN